MSKLTDKLLKNKKLKDVIKNTVNIEKPKEFYHCGAITLNLLLSGKVNGGIPNGKISLLSAPRAHFKTIIATIASANAQKKGEFVLWIDSEYAFDANTAKMFGMDLSDDKFLLVQENSLEEVRTIILNIFEDYDNKEDGNIFMVVDSIGTMITSKTYDDALAGEDKTDMTISKKKNDLSKLILGVSGKKKVTVVMIAHLYEDMKQYSTGAISGGSGIQYVSSQILKITSKSKEKDKEGIVEKNNYTCYTEKGRMSRENSKLQFQASYNDGVNTWYGLLPDALAGGYVDKPSNGFYNRPHIKDDKKIRESQMYNNEFWIPIMKDTDFINYLETKYSYVNNFEEKHYNTSLELE